MITFIYAVFFVRMIPDTVEPTVIWSIGALTLLLDVAGIVLTYTAWMTGML